MPHLLLLLLLAADPPTANPPAIDKPISFETPAANAIVAQMQIFPADNPWNADVSKWPIHRDSAKIIAAIGANKPLRHNLDMCYVLVPPNQKRVELQVVDYPDESDKGPFPIPDNVPIEGWPHGYLEPRGGKKITLDDVQRDVLKEGGDRHAIVVDPAQGMLYEFYQLKKTDRGWTAAQASVFNLASNALRPDGWTSSDAAGLPIFPAIVRQDELAAGEIRHALRVTVRRTRRAYVYPATHYASSLKDESLPRMGERIRLKADYDISRHSKQMQTILKALQKYGMLVADNGIEWAVSVAPDPRITAIHEELRAVTGKDFEVVDFPAGYVKPK